MSGTSCHDGYCTFYSFYLLYIYTRNINPYTYTHTYCAAHNIYANDERNYLISNRFANENVICSTNPSTIYNEGLFTIFHAQRHCE